MAVQHRTFHRFDPETCDPGRRRRRLAASLLAGFAAGALSVSLGAGPIRVLGEAVVSLASPAALRPAYPFEWHDAQLAVGHEGLIRPQH